MSQQKDLKKSQDLGSRFEKVKWLFLEIEKKIEFQKSQGELAPDGAWIVRYQARGKGGNYWYYKWQSREAIFITRDGKKSCHQYIGKAGSPAFMAAVEMMIRRTKIESLQQVRHTLELGLSDLVA